MRKKRDGIGKREEETDQGKTIISPDIFSLSSSLIVSQSCTRKVVQKGSTMPDGLHVCPLKYAWLLLHYCSKRKTGKLIGVVVGLLLLCFLFRCRSLHGNNSNHHNINIKPKATPKSNY